MKELEQMVEKYNLKEKILKDFEEFIKYNKESNPKWFNSFFEGRDPNKLEKIVVKPKRACEPGILELKLLLKYKGKNFATYYGWFIADELVDNFIKRIN